jgi:hypothetical protein
LYIHGELRKKINKKVALNYHEAPTSAFNHLKGQQRVTLEGFTDQFMEVYKNGRIYQKHPLPDIKMLPNSYLGDSRKMTN